MDTFQKIIYLKQNKLELLVMRAAICFQGDGFTTTYRTRCTRRENVLSCSTTSPILRVKNTVEKMLSISIGDGSLTIVIFPGFQILANIYEIKYYFKKLNLKLILINRFDGTKLLEKIRGKRLVFVGDSLGRNQWASMLCLIESSLYQLSSQSFVRNGNLFIFRAIVSSFRLYLIFFNNHQRRRYNF